MNIFKGLVAPAVLVALSSGAWAETPTPGGTLSVVMRSSPGAFDCHAAQGYSSMQAVQPAYNALLDYDPAGYPAIRGNLAESWEVAEDGMSVTFKLHEGVKFHDGTVMTSADVKASYERMMSPPDGVTPMLNSQFGKVESVEAPDDLTVVVNLNVASPAILNLFAHPNGCILSKALLESDPDYPTQTVMGTGPFKLKEFQTGAKLVYEKHPDYFVDGRPYLDQLDYLIIPRNGVVPAISGGQVDADFFTLGAPLQKQIKEGRGDSVKFETGGTSVAAFITMNTSKKPFDDVRVRRALAMAIDLEAAAQALPRIISVDGYKPPVFLSATPYALTDAELADLPGYESDPAAAKEAAKALLKEAGVEGLTFELTSLGSADPFETFAIFAIDQWRQIGVDVTKNTVAMADLLSTMRSSDYDAAIDWNSPISMDPDEVLAKHIPSSPSNYTHSGDEELNMLATQIAAELDPEKRAMLTKDFEKRLLGEAYTIPMLWATRTVAIPSNLYGWVMPPNFSLWLNMQDIWLEQ